MNAPIRFLNLEKLYHDYKGEFQNAMAAVLDRAAYIQGEATARFESEFALWVGKEEKLTCVGCANGTDAILMAAKALMLPKGSEAIIPAMTYFATAEALVHAGFTLKLVDTDKKTGLMDVGLLEKAVTENTRLIVPVHLFGQMVPMDAVSTIAKKHGCAVLEDAAQAHGATWKGKPVGYWGDIATYSFYPGKNLGAFGDAGAVISKNQEYIRYCRAFGNHGGIQKYEHGIVGMNSRLDTLQAAVLSVKLKYIDVWNERRRQIASWYREGLSGLAGLELIEENPAARSVYHLFPVRVANRESFRHYLQEKKIETGVHYPKAIHELPAFIGLFHGLFPNATELAACGVSLPMCPTLNEQDITRVVSEIRGYFRK